MSKSTAHSAESPRRGVRLQDEPRGAGGRRSSSPIRVTGHAGPPRTSPGRPRPRSCDGWTRLQDRAQRRVTSADPRLTRRPSTWPAGSKPSGRRSGPPTFRGYSSHVRTYWLPAIGAVPLAELDPDRRRSRHVDPVRPGYRPGHLSGRRGQRSGSRSVGRFATGSWSRNVAAQKAPDRVSPVARLITLDVHQVRAMIEATTADEYGAAWTLAATTGLRLGELLGLSFDDIDSLAGTLSVRRSLARDHGNGWELADAEDDPKRMHSRVAGRGEVKAGPSSRPKK